jgi:hypothetical protein
MNRALPAAHLMLTLKRNEDIRLVKGNDNDLPFFDSIENIRKEIVEKCKNKTVEGKVFPYSDEDDDQREINYKPFSGAIDLDPSTVLPEDNSVNYIIKDLNTDWSLSAVEQLTNIYNSVTIYRLYTHMPFKLKFVIACTERVNDNVGPLTQSVSNKINAGNIYKLMRTALEWTRSIIWCAETDKDVYISNVILKHYYRLLSKLLEEL